MELDKTKNILHIPTGDYELVIEMINKFNDIYKAEFVYKDSVDVDGVMFSYIDITNVTSDQIFLFGCMYGSKIKELREKGEIDW